MRYDLTVPFARFIAQTGKTYQNIKRYHIAKVYRRDQPSLAKGRMREFYQCDFDIAGTYDSMIPDSEAIMVMVTILDRLNVGKFQVKVNHRKILDGMFQICGVPESLTRQISSAVDKLDKMPWNLVKQEMIEKGLDEDCADKIGVYVKMNGTSELLDKLLLDESFSTNETTLAGLNDLKLLSSFLSAFGISDFIKFDLSLARGLDYYTGVIYEAVVLGGDVGSVASGGRYDNLVGMFSGGATIPCVGISIGVERVYALLAKKELENKSSIVQVYVCGLGSGTLIERMKICKELYFYIT